MKQNIKYRVYKVSDESDGILNEFKDYEKAEQFALREFNGDSFVILEKDPKQMPYCNVYIHEYNSYKLKTFPKPLKKHIEETIPTPFFTDEQIKELKKIQEDFDKFVPEACMDALLKVERKSRIQFRLYLLALLFAIIASGLLCILG